MDERRSAFDCYLDCGLDTLETVRRYGIYSRSLDQFEVTKRCEVKAKILQCIRRLVDQKDIWVPLMSIANKIVHQRKYTHQA
jgi:hypothetical protein